MWTNEFSSNSSPQNLITIQLAESLWKALDLLRSQELFFALPQSIIVFFQSQVGFTVGNVFLLGWTIRPLMNLNHFREICNKSPARNCIFFNVLTNNFWMIFLQICSHAFFLFLVKLLNHPVFFVFEPFFAPRIHSIWGTRCWSNWNRQRWPWHNELTYEMEKGNVLDILLMEENPANQWKYGKYPIIWRVSFMLGGAGFLPSTVAGQQAT